MQVTPAGSRRVTHIVGLERNIRADLYHILLNKPWHFLFGLVLLIYLFANAIFATLFVATGPCLANAEPGSFSDAFFFSVQTLATIGYGYMYPTCFSAHVLVTLESLCGLVGFAVMTGLAFNKFSRPRARVIFSEKAVITRHDGQEMLMFRIANERSNYVADATLHVVLVKQGVTAEGRSFNRMKDVPLVRQRSSMFVLSWTAMHILDAVSPIQGENPETLADGNAILVCTLTGYDAAIGQTIHARHVYQADQLVWGHRLVDILTAHEGGMSQTIDYTKFHQIEPA